MIWVFLVLMALTVPAFAEEAHLSFLASDKVLVVAPHPDDEALGLAGILQAAKEAHASVRVVYFTQGESNEISSLFYQKRPLLSKSDFLKNGITRKNESMEAMRLLGLSPEDLVFFGYPDAGTMNIWLKYWGNKVYRSMLTRINKVSYKDNYSYGSLYKGNDIVHDFERLLLDFNPNHVFVTAPFDLNTDHQAAYLFLRVAMLNIQKQLDPSLALHLYPVHAHQWPDPKKLDVDAVLTVPDHIEWKDGVAWHSHRLTPDQVEKKKQTILKYRSQIAYKKNFLLAFARKNELWIDYPNERLFYEVVGEDPLATFGNSARDGDVVYRVIDSELWVSVPLTNMLDEMGVLSVYIFSYRKDFLFSDMPKLTFKLFGNKLFVYDGFKPIHNEALVYKMDKERLFLKIPLSILKEPDHLFVSARMTKEEVSLDFGSWKLLELVKTT